MTHGDLRGCSRRSRRPPPAAARARGRRAALLPGVRDLVRPRDDPPARRRSPLGSDAARGLPARGGRAAVVARGGHLGREWPAPARATFSGSTRARVAPSNAPGSCCVCPQNRREASRPPAKMSLCPRTRKSSSSRASSISWARSRCHPPQN